MYQDRVGRSGQDTWIVAPVFAITPAIFTFRSLILSTLSFAVLFAFPATIVAQDDPMKLDSLVVTVHRLPVALQATSASVTVLDGRELENAGMISVLDALRSVPGIAVNQSGSFGSVASIFMRGGESDYTAVLIDGVQVNEPGGRFDFAHLTVQQIDRIEIVRGPTSSMYGSDAVTGVIQIFTRTGSGGPQGGLTVLGGTYDSWRGSANIEGGGSIASYGLAASGFRSDGSLAFNNDYDNVTISSRVNLTPDDQTALRLSAQYSDHTFHFPTDGAGALVDENSNTFGEDLTLSLDARHQLTSGVELALLLATRNSDAGTDDAQDGPADSLGFFAFQSLDDISRQSLDLRTNVQLGSFGTASAGFEYEDQSLRSTSESDSEFGPSSGISDESRTNRAYYGQWFGQWGQLAANASIRLEDNGTFGSLVTYSIGSAFLISDSNTKLRGSVGRGIKEPTLFENFASGFAVGNPDLVPEESVSWEFGVDQYFEGGRYRLSATYFDQSFEDLIQFTFVTAEPGDPNFFNVGAADVRGFEAEAGAIAGPVSFSVNYTYLDSEVVDAGFEVGPDATFVSGERLLRRPVSQFAIEASSRLGSRGTAGLSLRHVGDRIDRDFSAFPFPRVTLPATTIVDARGEFSVAKPVGHQYGVSLIARIENLFDRKYSEIQGFPARGRTIWLGGRLSLGGE